MYASAKERRKNVPRKTMQYKGEGERKRRGPVRTKEKQGRNTGTTKKRKGSD